MNLTPESTEYAVALHTKLREAIARRAHVMFSLTSEETEKRKDFIQKIKTITDSSDGYQKGSFRKFIYDVIPVWQEEVDHNEVHDFSVWLPEEVIRHFSVSQDFVRAVNGLLANSYGSTEEVLEARIDRIEYGLSIKPNWFTTFISKSFYDADFPVEWLDYFAAREKFYMPAVVIAFNKGFRPEVLKVINGGIQLHFTPEEVDIFLNVYNPRLLKQLASLETHGRQKLTLDLLMKLAEVGYISAKEVKDYARKFGVGFTDADFYDRVITAKERFPILETYVPVV